MDPMLAEINRRLTELETRFAFQDDLLAVLNPRVAVQERKIQDLAEEIRHLHREITALRSVLGHGVVERTPNLGEQYGGNDE